MKSRYRLKKASEENSMEPILQELDDEEVQ